MKREKFVTKNIYKLYILFFKLSISVCVDCIKCLPLLVSCHTQNDICIQNCEHIVWICRIENQTKVVKLFSKETEFYKHFLVFEKTKIYGKYLFLKGIEIEFRLQTNR